MERPLVTFGLKTYNQLAYVQEALDGAFAQTYRPLEIVICDDGSTDGTWELVAARVAAERAARSEEIGSGELSVVAERNVVNLGNTKNFERVGELAHGELVVKADGDDISLPERTARIVEAWLADGKRAQVITHAVRTMDGGRILDGHDAKRPLGAGMAWARACFRGWPEIGADCRRSFDDVVYSARGLLLGGELVLKDALVRYRVGSGETSQADPRHFYARGLEGVLAAEPQKRRDIVWAREAGIVDAERETAALAELERETRYYGAYYDLFAAPKLAVRWRAFRRVRGDFNWRGRLVFATYLLPGGLGAWLRGLLFSVRKRMRG